MPKRVLVAESNAYLLEILSGFLTACGFAVVGTTSREAELTELVRKSRPDLVIFDFSLSKNGMSGLSELQTLKSAHPELKILVLGFQDAADEFIAAVVKNGCDGFWNKFESQSGLLRTLKLMLA